MCVCVCVYVCVYVCVCVCVCVHVSVCDPMATSHAIIRIVKGVVLISLIEPTLLPKSSREAGIYKGSVRFNLEQ